MGETSAWGYAALIVAILGFAYGFWRQKHPSKKAAARQAAYMERQKALANKIDASEKSED